MMLAALALLAMLASAAGDNSEGDDAFGRKENLASVLEDDAMTSEKAEVTHTAGGLQADTPDYPGRTVTPVSYNTTEVCQPVEAFKKVWGQRESDHRSEHVNYRKQFLRKQTTTYTDAKGRTRSRNSRIKLAPEYAVTHYKASDACHPLVEARAVIWIGGPPGAGKTTTTFESTAYGFAAKVYTSGHCDTVT